MTLEAGRELDALVAEKVMGLAVRPHPYTGEKVRPWPSGGFASIPLYSTDIAAAWEAVEKIADGDWIWFYMSWEGKLFKATFRGTAQGMPTHEAKAATAPHAICLAALKAVGVQVS